MTPIEYAIRHGACLNQPHLLVDWLRRDIGVSNKEQALSRQWQHSLSQYELLMETIADELIDKHWRCWCLDNINRPLLRLQKLASTDEQRSTVNFLWYELRVISYEVRNSL